MVQEVTWDGQDVLWFGCRRSRAGERTHFTSFTHVYGPSWAIWASLMAQMAKNLPAMQGTWVQSLGWEDPLEKWMATHSGRPNGQRSLAGYSSWNHRVTSLSNWAHTSYGGPGVKICLQCRGLGCDPWQGTKIPHAPGQLSLGVLQLEKARMRQRRPSRDKKKKSKISLFCTKANSILFWLESLY